MISDKLEQAKTNPGEDHHLKFDLQRVIQVIESDRDHTDRVKDELRSLDTDHPVTRLIQALDTWESSDHSEFQSGINSALTALDQLHELALDKDWYSVASYSLLKSIEYREQLGGFDPTDRFEDVIDFLSENILDNPDVSLGQLEDHVEKMIDDLDQMDEDTIRSLLDIVESRARQLENDEQYMHERRYRHHQISIKNRLDEDVSEVENRLIESYEDEYELKSSANSMIKADILERAVAQCQPFLSEQKENDWRLRIRELNKQAREEMPVTEHEVDVGKDVSRIVDRFKEIKNKKSSWQVLKGLLYAPIGQGNYEKAKETIDEAPAANLFPRNVISPEGDTVGSEPGMNQDGERAPSGYMMELRVANHTLAVTIQRLIDENLLSEPDFYMLLSTIPGVSIQDEAFLTDATISFFEERYAETVHLAIPRLESITANVYQEMGKAVTKNQGQIYRQRGLGGLFGLIEDDISTNFGKYLQYRYTDTAGQNIRNRVAHGQIKYSATDFKLASTLLFDIFRVGARITNEYSGPESC
jgi:hypothetical protein